MKKKNTMTTMLLVVGLMILTVGVSIAFFNYTRTGNANTFSTGRISFNTTQNGNISLTNIFPIDSNDIDNLLETGNNVTINITGDTTYQYGVEYLVTAEDVNITVNEKKIPLNLYVSGTSNLGTNDDSYFENRGGNTSLYKVLSGGVVYDGQYLLVGYIAPGQTGIEGNLNIKAYIDKDKIAISDTYDGNESDNMGTTNNWVNGRTVFSTSEWNSFQGEGHELSFKIRVEANEGTWVDPYTTPNLMNTVNINRSGVNIKEIRFIHETPLRMQRRYDESIGQESNGTKGDLTYQDTGKVLAWIEPVSVSPTGTNNELLNIKPSFLVNDYNNENNIKQIDNEPEYILYIASSGETKWVTGSGLFAGFTNVERITFENVDSSNITSTSGMFYGCSSLTSIDLSGMGSNNLTSIVSMFSGCTNLATINMQNFNFGAIMNLNDGSGLFQGLTNLTSVNLSEANMSNVTNMSNLFFGNTNLTSVNLSGANTSNVTNMSNLFSGDTNLISVDLSGMGSDSLRYISKMFYNCNALRTVNMSNFNFGIVNFSELDNGYTNSYYAFSDLPNIETINLTNANTSGVTSMFDMFYNCKKLTNIIGINTLDTSHVTDMQYMFYNCNSLISLNLSNFNTSHVTNMQYMFYNCNSLTSLNLSNFNTSNVTDMEYMFCLCESLTSLNLSNFNTSSVTNMYAMFSACSNLTAINVTSFDTSHVTDMTSMFFGCESLTSLNLLNFITSSVTSMAGMFRNCKSLTIIDISSFNTTNVTNMSYMFAMEVDSSNSASLNNNLTTIYVGNFWTVAAVVGESSSDANMFLGCNHLVGGNGTSYNKSYISKIYARVDGKNGLPGYLTLKTN